LKRAEKEEETEKEKSRRLATSAKSTGLNPGQTGAKPTEAG
jgi:hypothetical protein